MFKKLATVLTIISAITFVGQAQSPKGWAAAHQNAHQKEQLATNKSRLDASVIERQRQEEVLAREMIEAGVSPETSAMLDDLLREAASHIGKRYVFGSKGPNQFDCSGFSGYVYRQFGYSIGACSRDQYKGGRAIDRKDVRRGDLVFFTSRSSGSNVGHVGIVWEVNKETGDFKFIHASTRRGVVISEFEGYYVKRFVGIKRIIE